MIEEIRNDIDAVATGKRIRELRDQSGLRITDISDALGFYEPQAVYKWMRGECLPTLRNIYRLSILFGTTIDDIVQGTETGEEGKSRRDTSKGVIEFNRIRPSDKSRIFA